MQNERRKKFVDKLSIIVIIVLFIFCTSLSLFTKKEKVIRSENPDDYKYKKLAVQAGASSELFASECYPDAELLRFEMIPDVLFAVDSENADAAFTIEVCADEYNAGKEKVKKIGESFGGHSTGILFGKSMENQKYLREFNIFLKKIKDSGEFDNIKDRWLKYSSKKIPIDTSKLKGGNGTVVLGADIACQPYTYVYENKPAGFDIELVYRFCEEYGYNLDIYLVEFTGLLSGLKSGKYGLVAGGMSITEERKKSLDFSDPIAENNYYLYIKNSDYVEKFNIISYLKEGLYKTFIVENRYKLFLEGIGMTFFITIFSIIFGTILSFLICIYRLTESKLANKICDIYVSLLQGTPIVVLLMLLYYAVFNNSSLEPKFVAIIGFTLNFSAYVSEIMITSIRGVSEGQIEAARAMGYSEAKTFIKFVFPQSLVSIIPVYKGEVISLFKSTSIVGYIAIQDMTKMSDVVRSRTFEPFIPIAFIAIFYCVIAFLVSKILEMVLLKIDWKKRK